MPRSGPTTLALPPFAGATRKLILISVGVFFAEAVLRLVLPAGIYQFLYAQLILLPRDVLHGEIWQLLTYAFLPIGILGTLFAMLTLWFTGSMLEGIRGSRWVYELFLTSAVAGALMASAIAYTRLFHLDPASSAGVGPWAAIYGLLIGIAVLLGDQEFLLLFIVRIKAKYLVAIYVLIDLATLLKASNTFEALLHLSGALSAYMFIRYVPRRGIASGFMERVYALRNDYYRSKRRRTARKFEVYMRAQNREVHFDNDGRYIEPEKRDPNDKKWMN